MSSEPTLCFRTRRDMYGDDIPKLKRVIRFKHMCEFMSDEVVYDKRRRLDDSPVERQCAARRTGTPAILHFAYGYPFERDAHRMGHRGHPWRQVAFARARYQAPKRSRAADQSARDNSNRRPTKRTSPRGSVTSSRLKLCPRNRNVSPPTNSFAGRGFGYLRGSRSFAKSRIAFSSLRPRQPRAALVGRAHDDTPVALYSDPNGATLGIDDFVFEIQGRQMSLWLRRDHSIRRARTAACFCIIGPRLK